MYLSIKQIVGGEKHKYYWLEWDCLVSLGVPQWDYFASLSVPRVGVASKKKKPNAAHKFFCFSSLSLESGLSVFGVKTKNRAIARLFLLWR